MAFRVVVRPSVRQAIASWGLSDHVLVDVYLQLNDLLASSPTTFLRRAVKPFDGMLFEFNLIDPGNRFRVHFFVFLIVYGQDEQTLIAANAGYVRRDKI